MNNYKHHFFISDTVLVIKVPDARVLRVVSRSLILALALATLPFLGLILKGSLVSGFESVTDTALGFVNAEALNLILHDLAEEGLFRKEDKALILGPLNGLMLKLNNGLDSEYDFVFTQSFEDAVFADRILKMNGIVAFPLSIDSSNAGFTKQSNYRFLKLRRYGPSIIVVLRKIGLANSKLVLAGSSSPKRKLCQMAIQEEKITALKGLEDVLLEPPTEGFAFAKSNKNLKVKFLPELLGDSLEGYKRRFFIGVGLHEENRAAIKWFQRNYPKKGKKFEIHSLLVAPEDSVARHTDVSAWLSKHVREEEYVVMKAEADVVEEMIQKRTICLVDELFLECNNEWWDRGKKRKKSGRAYWECLALYGRLRDEGVAVHQWWD